MNDLNKMNLLVRLKRIRLKNTQLYAGYMGFTNKLFRPFLNSNYKGQVQYHAFMGYSSCCKENIQCNALLNMVVSNVKNFERL